MTTQTEKLHDALERATRALAPLAPRHPRLAKTVDAVADLWAAVAGVEHAALAKRATPTATDDTLHDMQKAATVASAADDDALCKVLEALSDELGTTNPERLAAACLAALSPLPHEAIVEMTKALAGTPIDMRPFGGNLPSAMEERFRNRAAFLDLKKAAGDASPGEDVERRFHQEAAELMPMLRSMKPMTFERPARPDRRNEYRGLRDSARAQGDDGGAAMWEKELAAEEMRVAVGTPSARVTARGVVPVAAV